MRVGAARGAGRSLGFPGKGVGVAVIDSGHNGPYHFTATTSRSRIVYEQDFTASSVGARDEYGHGTHVAGILTSRPIISSGGMTLKADMRGVAPGANLIVLKVLDKNGAGKDSSVIAAIDRAIALKTTYNIRVMNLSLGRPVTVSYKSDLLCQAVERAWKAGIVVVVSAGNHGRLNNGYGTITAPGNSPFVITVGAMKAMNTASRGDDQLASYSSKGPSLIDWVAKSDLVAPGNQMISLATPAGYHSPTDLFWTYPETRIPLNRLWNNAPAGTDTWFYRLNGTSMAAPMVSGTAALMIERDPTLTPDQVKARLMKTASKTFPASSIATDPVTGQTFKVNYDMMSIGAGYLDIAAALNNTQKVTGNAQSPITKLASGKVTVTFAAGSSFSTLSTNVLWGGNVGVGRHHGARR